MIETIDDPPLLQVKQNSVYSAIRGLPYRGHSIRIKRLRSAERMDGELDSFSGGFFPFGKHPWDCFIFNPHFSDGVFN